MKKGINIFVNDVIRRVGYIVYMASNIIALLIEKQWIDSKKARYLSFWNKRLWEQKVMKSCHALKIFGNLVSHKIVK